MEKGNYSLQIDQLTNTDITKIANIIYFGGKACIGGVFVKYTYILYIHIYFIYIHIYT